MCKNLEARLLDILRKNLDFFSSKPRGSVEIKDFLNTKLPKLYRVTIHNCKKIFVIARRRYNCKIIKGKYRSRNTYRIITWMNAEDVIKKFESFI